MNILRNLQVPTGNILVVNGDKGKLECLSIGDYGKDLNIKADFLGITDEIKGVQNSDIMPLEKKWGYYYFNSVWMLNEMQIL